MKKCKVLLIAVLCMDLVFNATISLGQPAPGEFATLNIGAGANLVVTSVSGPAEAFPNQTVAVTYTVKNIGDVASGAYQVRLCLSQSPMFDPLVEPILLKNVTFSTGLAPGEVRKTRTRVVVPNYHVNGLSGDYYLGAVVATSNKASAKPVFIVRYSLGDDNNTVTDQKTGLIWQRATNGTQRDHAAAIQYCWDLVLGGKTDWRLPSIEELETIIIYRIPPAIDPVFDCRSDNYWSSSDYIPGHGDAYWVVSFDWGSVEAAGEDYGAYVRCVRGKHW